METTPAPKVTLETSQRRGSVFSKSALGCCLLSSVPWINRDEVSKCWAGFLGFLWLLRLAQAFSQNTQLEKKEGFPKCLWLSVKQFAAWDIERLRSKELRSRWIKKIKWIHNVHHSSTACVAFQFSILMDALKQDTIPVSAILSNYYTTTCLHLTCLAGNASIHYLGQCTTDIA